MNIFFKPLFYIATVLLLTMPLLAQAKTSVRSVSLDKMKAYRLEFSPVSAVDQYQGSKVLGEVTHKRGEKFSVFLPFDIQQVKFLVSDGKRVSEGQKIAQVYGTDVHHFLDEYQTAKTLYQVNLAQYNNSEALFKRKSIKQSAWLAVSNEYFAAKLRMEHIQHAMSVLIVENDEQVFLKTPKAGIVSFENTEDSRQAAQDIFDVIEPTSLVVTAKLPQQHISTLSALNVFNSNCQLTVAQVDESVELFMQQIWSAPLIPACSLTVGQQVVLSPMYQITGYQSAKSAVFEIDNIHYIAIKQGDTLVSVPINLVSANAHGYIFTASERLDNAEVLLTSVSALQGILLALGEE